MTRAAVDALRADRDEALGLFRSLGDAEWSVESGCAGWSVQDLCAHLAASFHPTWSLVKGVVGGGDLEDLNDQLVDERRGATSLEQLDEYETWSHRAVGLLAMVQRRPLSGLPVTLGDLGRHPVHRLANAAAFDHYTHLRVDLVGPLGPLDRKPLPQDALRLDPVIGWMTALFPKLCGPALRWLDEPVALRLHGPGGGEWTVAREGEAVTLEPGRATAAAAIVTTTHEFVVWGTKRRPWRDRDVELTGDADLAGRVADAVRIF